MSAAYPMVLVDAPEDGCVEERGWVEATPEIDTAAKAIAYLEKDFPLDGDGWGYRVPLSPPKSWHRPEGIEMDHGGYYVVEGGPCETCKDGKVKVIEAFDAENVKLEVKLPAYAHEIAEAYGHGVMGHVTVSHEEECGDCYGTGKKGYPIDYMPWERCEHDARGAVEFWNLEALEVEIASEAGES